METQKINRIVPCLWFDDQAEEAANFYTSLFNNSEIGSIARYGKAGHDIHGQPEGRLMTVELTLAGQSFTALNGGPHFKFTPAISFFVVCETEREVDTLWEKLSKGGEALMPLDQYDWSAKYGWVQDRYGLSWQISHGKLEDVHGQKITPSLMFVSEKGKAEKAINHYTSVFKKSDITGILRYEAGESLPGGMVKHAQFKLNGEVFMAMDGGKDHEFNFNEAISFVVSCETQDEIDYYWEKLSAVPAAEQCGWLKDKFDVSWQIVPQVLNEILKGEATNKSERVIKAMLQMKKLDITALKRAYQQEPA